MQSVKKAISAVVASLVLASSIIFQANVTAKAGTTDKNNGDWSKPRVTLGIQTRQS